MRLGGPGGDAPVVRYLGAAVVASLALVTGNLIWPALMIQALVALVVTLLLGGGPGLLAAAIVCAGTAFWVMPPDALPREQVNVALLVAVCLGAVWAGHTQHSARRLLRRQAAQQAALAEMGRRALTREGTGDLIRDAVALTARSLEVEFCHFLTLTDDGRTLRLDAGVGWETALVGKACLDLEGPLEPSYLVPTWGPFVLETLDTKQRFPPPPWLHDRGARAGMRTVVPGDNSRPRPARQ